MPSLAARLLPVLIAAIAMMATASQAQVGQTTLPPPDMPRPIVPPQPPLPHPVIQRDLTLTDMRVEISIDGAMARTTIRQTLRNDNTWVAEGQYMLPLPPGASVSDFAILDGDQRLSAKLLPADEARRIYEEIVRKMRDPGLLEFQDRSTYSVAVFPFQPGQSRTIEVSFQQALGGTTDLVAYQLPLRWAGWSRLGDYGGGAKLVLTYDVRSSFPLGVISSPTFGVSVNREGDNRAMGSFEGTVTHFSSDFVLNIGRRTGDFAATLTCFPGSGEEGYFLLSLLAALPRDDKYTPKDILFIFDKSGSMSGEKIDQAKAALRFVLGQLRSEDRFNVVYYSDYVQQVFDRLRAADSGSVQQARDAVQMLTADGSTNIDGALTTGAWMLGRPGAALQTSTAAGEPLVMPAGLTEAQRMEWVKANVLASADAAPMSRTDGYDRPTYVIFMTDGLPTVGDTNVDNIIANAKRNFDPSVKVFVFGVGYDVNTTLLDSLSYNHHGSATYVTEGENIETKLSQFYARISSPAMVNVRLDMNGLDEYDMMPQTPPDLFHNSEVFITGRYRGEPLRTVGVQVQSPGKNNSADVVQANVSPNVSKEHSTVPRLWATRKVSWLLDQVRLKGDNKELIGEIDRLATRFGIVTPYTSYLITEPGMLADDRMRALEENIQFSREDESGQMAVGRSKMNQANQSQSVAAAPQSAGQAAGGADHDGYGFLIPEPRPAPPMDRSHGRADNTTTVNYVNEQTFVRGADSQQRTQWIDARFAKDTQRNIRVQAFSDAYFELLAEFPELGDYLAQGENVVFVVSDALALETTADEIEVTDADLDALREALRKM